MECHAAVRFGGIDRLRLGNTVAIGRISGHVAGRAVGMLTLVMFRVPTGLRAIIEDVVVDASARGKGIGEAMSRQAIALVRSKGAQTIDLKN